MVKNILENDPTTTEIPLPNCDGATLERIVQFILFHGHELPPPIEKPLRSKQMNENVSQWDADFIEGDDEYVFTTLLAANYMDVKPVFDLGCAKVASEMKGKSVDEIKARFKIKDKPKPDSKFAKFEEKAAAERGQHDSTGSLFS